MNNLNNTNIANVAEADKTLEEKYFEAFEAYQDAKREYRNHGSEVKYLAARERCIAAGRALNAAAGWHD